MEKLVRPLVMVPISIAVGLFCGYRSYLLLSTDPSSGFNALWLMAAIYFLGAPFIAGLMELADRMPPIPTWRPRR